MSHAPKFSGLRYFRSVPADSSSRSGVKLAKLSQIPNKILVSKAIKWKQLFRSSQEDIKMYTLSLES